MANTRYGDLLAELDKRGWLAGEWHQRQDKHGNRAILFDVVGNAQIGVMAALDIAAHSHTKRVIALDPKTGKKQWAAQTINRPAIKGVGYVLTLDGNGQHLQATSKNAAEAVALMSAWRDQRKTSNE